LSHVINKRQRSETYPDAPKGGGAGVQSVSGTLPVVVDNTDPSNPSVGLETPNVVQGVDTAGGTTTPQYDFSQSFTPGSRGVLVIGSVSFSTGTPGDRVEVWLEEDNNAGVRLNGLTLQSAGSGLQSVTIQALNSPTPDTLTGYRIFAHNTTGRSITVPAGGASVLVSGF
jgi:hypothetical protein